MPKLPPSLAPFVASDGDTYDTYLREDLGKSSLTREQVPEWAALQGQGIANYTGIRGQLSSGYVIPYFRLDGQPLIDSDRAFMRFKLKTPLSQELSDNGEIKSSGKYVSHKGSSWHIYIPRETARLLAGASQDLPLVITEGEKKAESVVHNLGLPCVALAGIQVWFDPTQDKREAMSSRALHPELVEVLDVYRKWAGSTPVVLVLFDSDGAPRKPRDTTPGLIEITSSRGKKVRVLNQDVYRAAMTLARRVYDSLSFSVAVHPCWVPVPDGQGDLKLGIDDWIVAAGAAEVSDALQTLAESPIYKIQNENGLPAYVLTHNVAQDVDALVACLRKHEHVYTFGNNLALVEPESTSIRVVSHEMALARELSRLIQTYEQSTKDGSVSACYVPQRLSLGLLHLDWEAESGMRPVRALAQHPVPMMLDNESIHVGEAGYDAKAQIFGAYDPDVWEIPAHPTAADYSEACAALAELMDEMYLQSPSDVAAMVAAILTAVCRPGLPVAPGLVISAPNSGAGKSYIANVLTALASNHEADVLTLETRGPNASTEFTKMVLGALATPSPVMLFDEIDDNKIDSPSLRKLITSPVFSGRKLGANEVMSLPTRKFIAITANNVDPTQDSARRFMIVRINPPDDASKRRQNPTRGAVDLVQSNRTRYVRAAVIVCLAGMQLLEQHRDELPLRMPRGINILSGFAAWSRVCAGPALVATWRIFRMQKHPANLVETAKVELIQAGNPVKNHLDMLDPMLRQRQTLQEDPAREALRDLLSALHQFQTNKVPHKPQAVRCLGPHGEQGFTADLLVDELREQRHIADKYQRDVNNDYKLEDFALLQELRSSGLRDDQISVTRKLGLELSKHRDRSAGGLVLVQLGSSQDNSRLWHVKRTASVVTPAL